MIKSTFRSFAAALGTVAIFGASNLAAQEGGGPPTLTAPVSQVVTPAGGGEALKVEGSVTVSAEVTATADGSRLVSYSFTWMGSAVGQASGNKYEIAGGGSERTPLDVPLPADVGLNTRFTASSGATAHRFSVLLQGSIKEDGTLASIVVRTIVPVPK